ncbi:MAG: heat-inducible transcription repressor HrcA [Candidatus Omnitrophica bacterium]|nr:heat-inducible transcription repressor HrcA [Candidatus Omnitrophota bacterium]
MRVNDLETRRKAILRAIVQSHIESAAPVGSRTISRLWNLGLSPASIRNVMADLEEQGFITQPHTSAGRVPTQAGYRCYVDDLMEPEQLTQDLRGSLMQLCQTRWEMLEEFLRRTAELLSELTGQAAVVVSPRLISSRFRRVELFIVEGRRVLAVWVIEPGLLQNRLVDMEEKPAPELLERTANYMNHRLRGLTLLQARDVLERDALSVEGGVFPLVRCALELVDKLAKQSETDRVYSRGTSRILCQPEFAEAQRVQELVLFLEEQRGLYDLLSPNLYQEGMRVCIGAESGSALLQDCTLITCTYSAGGWPVGVLGVVGPMRMNYPRSLTAVSYMARLFSALLDGEREIRL